MTSTIARLVLAMLLLPATGAVFLIALIATQAPWGPTFQRLLGVWFIVYAFIGIYWVLLWRSSVRWTIRRVLQTILTCLVALAGGVVVGVLCQAMNGHRPQEVEVLVGGGTVPIIWILGTVLVWRETAAERVERLARLSAAVLCPLCGYNLAGLRDTRCPECGSSLTLDQLVASQPRAEHAADTL